MYKGGADMKRVIREGARGSSHVSAENIIPPDAEKLTFETRSYEFFIHRCGSHTTIYVQTTDYHPGILAIPLEKLIEFVHYIMLSED
jgi:hypothetical protein